MMPAPDTSSCSPKLVLPPPHFRAVIELWLPAGDYMSQMHSQWLNKFQPVEHAQTWCRPLPGLASHFPQGGPPSLSPFTWLEWTQPQEPNVEDGRATLNLGPWTMVWRGAAPCAYPPTSLKLVTTELTMHLPVHIFEFPVYICGSSKRPAQYLCW